MTLSQAFHKAVYGIGQAIDKSAHGILHAIQAFSGRKALKARDLHRADGGFWTTVLGLFIGATAATAIFAATPLSIIFATAAAIEGTFAPLQIQAAYILGKDEHKNAKPAARHSLKK